MPYDLSVPIKETAHKRRPSGKNGHTVVQDSADLLDYYAEAYSGKQAINKGRLALRPDIHLGDYTFKAEVDWIRISFDTTGQHQAVNIRRWASTHIGKGQTIYVDGPKDEDGNVGCAFTLTLQNPAPGSFHELCDALEKEYSIDTTEGQAIRIDGIEVSLDIYPNNGSDKDRRRMTEILRRHVSVPEFFWEDPRAHPRSVFGDRTELNRHHPVVCKPKKVHLAKSQAAGHPALTPELFRDADPSAYEWWPVDGTFYIGGKGDVAMVRIQDKVTDQRRGPHARKLEQHMKRSRIEVTLERFVLLELGIEFEMDIRELGFDHLVAGVFATSIPTLTSVGDTPDAKELQVFERGGALGLDRYQRARHIECQIEAGTGRGSRRPSALGTKGHGIAWEEFRHRSRKALKRLEEQWRR